MILDTTPFRKSVITLFRGKLRAILHRNLPRRTRRTAITDTPTTPAALLVIAVQTSLLIRFFATFGHGQSTAGNRPWILCRAADAHPWAYVCLSDPWHDTFERAVILPIIDETGYKLLWFGVILEKLTTLIILAALIAESGVLLVLS